MLRWLIELRRSSRGRPTTTVLWKLKQAEMKIFLPQAPSLRIQWNSYSSLCTRHFKKDGAASGAVEKRMWSLIDNTRDNWVNRKHCETGRARQDTNTHLTWSLNICRRWTICAQWDAELHWRCRRDGCRLWWTLTTSSRIWCTHGAVQSASSSPWRTVRCSEVIKLPIVKDHLTWVLCHHHQRRMVYPVRLWKLTFVRVLSWKGYADAYKWPETGRGPNSSNLWILSRTLALC